MYGTLIGPKPLRIRFDKIDGFIRVYVRSRYLVSLGTEKYHAIYSRVKYFTGQKSGIRNAFSRYYTKIKVDSYDSSPIEKMLILHNVMMHINSVLYKDQNYYYYYNIFLETCSYELAKNNENLFLVV